MEAKSAAPPIPAVIAVRLSCHFRWLIPLLLSPTTTQSSDLRACWSLDATNLRPKSMCALPSRKT